MDGLDQSLEDMIEKRKAGGRGGNAERGSGDNPPDADGGGSGRAPRRRGGRKPRGAGNGNGENGEENDGQQQGQRRGGRGGRGGGGRGGDTVRDGGVAKASSNRGSPGGGNNNNTNEDGEPKARRPRRRTGRPRPNRRDRERGGPRLPRYRVDDATGALIILFDDTAVATVGVDGAVAFDTRELFAKSAAEPPAPPPPPMEVDEEGRPVGRRGRRPETGNKARSGALRGALNAALAAAGLRIVTAAQAAAAAAGAGGGDAAAVRPREAISAVAAEGSEAVLDEWIVLLSSSDSGAADADAGSQPQLPFIDGMVLPAVAGRMAAVKDALQAAFEDQEARRAARDARVASKAAEGEAMAVE